jgi:hypothetical protein
MTPSACISALKRSEPASASAATRKLTCDGRATLQQGAARHGPGRGWLTRPDERRREHG